MGARVSRTIGVLAALVCLMAPWATARDDGLVSQGQRRGRLFAEAVNAEGDRVRELIPQIYAESVLEEIGLERLSGLFARLHEAYAPLGDPVCEVTRVGSGGSARAVLHVFAKDRAGTWRDFQIRQSVEEPYALTELAFVGEVTEPIALPNGAITAPETLAWLRGYAARLEAEHELSCSLLIADRDRVLLEVQTGRMDASGSRPNTPSTRFGVASIGKVVTALAVGRLVDQGRLSFDDPLATFLPGFGGDEFARACTVRHLLSHTSGVPEYWTEEFARQLPQFQSLEGYLEWITRRPIEFAPGERFSYSNSNYILLGLIIEAVTGQDYFEVARREVLEPLGMADTSFVREASNTAEPLEGEPGRWRAVEWSPDAEGVLHCSSAGGMVSTARDLARLGAALRDSTLLRPETMREMRRSQVGQAEVSDWGLGIELHTQAGVLSYGHGGTAPGAQGMLRVFPDEGLVVVLLANQNVPAFDDLRRNTLRLITGER